MELVQAVLPWVGGVVLGFALCFVLLRQRKEQAVSPTSPKPSPRPSPRPSAEPLRLLALLQRDARLLDFLMEDVRAYADEDIGRAVREIHRQSQEALHKHLVLEPVLPQKEEERVTVPAGFDPSAIRLTGNVTGQPPFSGTLKHAGWRVREIKLAPSPHGQDEFVLMPAEVHLESGGSQ